jgi:hypothetical protein
MNLHTATWIECNSTKFNLNSNSLNEIYIEIQFNSIQFSKLKWISFKFNMVNALIEIWIELNLVELNQIQFNSIQFGWIKIKFNSKWLQLNYFRNFVKLNSTTLWNSIIKMHMLICLFISM